MAAKGMKRKGMLMAILEFTRVRVTFAVTLTAATGWFLGSGRFEPEILFPLVGVFLLASGSSALNQVQEWKTDALMERTRNRPIPAGTFDRITGLFMAVLLMLFGMSLLASAPANTGVVLALGLFAVVWYNGLYTYLKKVTAFAVVPGALIGAVPPVIGYAAAGGDPADPLIIVVAWFFFMWQIPHFWLLLLICGEQYTAAGLPSLTMVFSRRQLLRITLTWLLAVSAAGFALPALAAQEMTWPWKLAMVAASAWLALDSLSILGETGTGKQIPAFRRAFRQINIYAVLAMLFMSLSGLGAAG